MTLVEEQEKLRTAMINAKGSFIRIELVQRPLIALHEDIERIIYYNIYLSQTLPSYAELSYVLGE